MDPLCWQTKVILEAQLRFIMRPNRRTQIAVQVVMLCNEVAVNLLFARYLNLVERGVRLRVHQPQPTLTYERRIFDEADWPEENFKYHFKLGCHYSC